MSPSRSSMPTSGWPRRGMVLSASSGKWRRITAPMRRRLCTTSRLKNAWITANNTSAPPANSTPNDSTASRMPLTA